MGRQLRTPTSLDAFIFCEARLGEGWAPFGLDSTIPHWGRPTLHIYELGCKRIRSSFGQWDARDELMRPRAIEAALEDLKTTS